MVDKTEKEDTIRVSNKGYRAGIEKGRQEVIKEIERERFETPQYIAESGSTPVIICLTEGDLQALKQKYLKPT